MLINSSLLNFIQESLKQGLTKESITKSLVDNGWQLGAIEEAFLSLGNNLTQLNIPEVQSIEANLTDKKNIKKWLMIGGVTIVIISLGFFGYKMLIKEKSETPQITNLEQRKVPTAPVEFIMKNINFEDEKEKYSVIYNKDKSCFIVVVTQYYNSDTGNIDYSYIHFLDYVIGPIQLYDVDNIVQFSKDCSVVAFSGKKDDGLFYLYKNGEQINEGRPYPYDFYLEPNSKKVVYSFINQSSVRRFFFEDNKQIGSYNVSDEFSFVFLDKDTENVVLSPDGSRYAIKVHEVNYDLTDTQIPNIPENEFNIKLDKSLDQDQMFEKFQEDVSKLSESDQEKFINQIAEANKKLTWESREFLIVDGEQTEYFDKIQDFRFSDNNEFAFIASRQTPTLNEDYLFFKNKLEKINSLNEFGGSINYLLALSPNGERYGYIRLYSLYSPSGTPFSDFNKVELFIDGQSKLRFSNSQFQNDYSQKLLFSPDSQHFAYLYSEDGDNYYSILDDKKSEVFHPAETRHEEIYIFSPESKLYFVGRNMNQKCIYINNTKEDCFTGQFAGNFLFSGDSYAYIQLRPKPNEENGGLRQSYVVFNKDIYGPYDELIYPSNLLDINSDNKKLIYKVGGKIYLNGSSLQNISSYEYDPIGFIAANNKDAIHIIGLENGKTVVYKDKQILVTLDTDVVHHGEIIRGNSFISPGPDRSSIWYIHYDQNKRQIVFDKIHLELK